MIFIITQVKPSAPNTIQYLPTRPQAPCHPGPRGPPSLDFLQRVTNPMQMDSSKVRTKKRNKMLWAM